jgi:hypothetical protein
MVMNKGKEKFTIQIYPRHSHGLMNVGPQERPKWEWIQDHVSHSVAMGYYDAALAGLWGIGSLPKIEMTSPQISHSYTGPIIGERHIYVIMVISIFLLDPEELTIDSAVLILSLRPLVNL